MHTGMESGPALFAGTSLAVFGAGLLLWTSARLRSGESVAEGVAPAGATALAVLFGVISLLTGGWLLLSG